MVLFKYILLHIHAWAPTIHEKNSVVPHITKILLLVFLSVRPKVVFIIYLEQFLLRNEGISTVRGIRKLRCVIIYKYTYIYIYSVSSPNN